MASTDPQPLDYDSGEDVIEVAYTPPSSRHGTTSTHHHNHHHNPNQQPPHPQQTTIPQLPPLSLPPLQLPQPPPQLASLQTQRLPQPQSQPPADRPQSTDNSNPPSRPTPPFQHLSDHIIELTRGLEGSRTTAEGAEQRTGRSSSSSTSGGVHPHRHHHRHHHHHHHHHHHRHARLGSQQTPVRLSTPSPPITITGAQSGGVTTAAAAAAAAATATTTATAATTAAGTAAVIDLTEEPDSPPRQHLVRSASDRYPSQTNTQHRHPRRTNSQRISPPSLERSDGSSSIPRSMRMASHHHHNHHHHHHVIDLTGDSPDDDVQPVHLPFGVARPPALRRAAAGGLSQQQQLSFHDQLFGLRHTATLGTGNPGGIPHGHPPIGGAGRDELVHVNVVPGPGRGGGVMTDIRGFGRRLAGYLGADMIGYHMPRTTRPNGTEVFHGLPPAAAAVLAARQPSPKPQLEVPPEARPGFTRSTIAEPEDGTIVVCPCCDEELAYDPRDTAASSGGGNNPSPASKKRKRSPGEHHFWALKKCGHVYCTDCFENRRPTKVNEGAGFPTTPVGKVQELRCAVDGCDTKIVAKGEWIGIFL